MFPLDPSTSTTTRDGQTATNSENEEANQGDEYYEESRDTLDSDVVHSSEHGESNECDHPGGSVPVVPTSVPSGKADAGAGIARREADVKPVFLLRPQPSVCHFQVPTVTKSIIENPDCALATTEETMRPERIAHPIDGSNVKERVLSCRWMSGPLAVNAGPSSTERQERAHPPEPRV